MTAIFSTIAFGLVLILLSVAQSFVTVDDAEVRKVGLVSYFVIAIGLIVYHAWLVWP